MLSFEHTIRNPIGLHALPAKLLADLVKANGYEMRITYSGRTVHAERVLQTVSLGAVTGATLLVEVPGELSEKDIELIRNFYNEYV